MLLLVSLQSAPAIQAVWCCGISFGQWPLRCWTTFGMVLGTIKADVEDVLSCLLDSVPVPCSCRGWLICESTLNKEPFIILHSELVWDYFIEMPFIWCPVGQCNRMEQVPCSHGLKALCSWDMSLACSCQYFGWYTDLVTPHGPPCADLTISRCLPTHAAFWFVFLDRKLWVPW